MMSRSHHELLATQSHEAARRHAESLEREELEVRAVVAGGLKAGRARTLCDPRRCGHLVERAALAPAHLIAGEREQIGLDVGLADAVNRVLTALRRRADRDSKDGDGQGSLDDGSC
jgi:hypothetical protein